MIGADRLGKNGPSLTDHRVVRQLEQNRFFVTLESLRSRNRLGFSISYDVGELYP